jgi:hypothetical protein
MTGRTLRRPLVASAVGASIWVLAACGGSTNPAPMSGPTIDLTIAKGQATPTNTTLQAKVNQQIMIHVTSDAKDELHVHSKPDHKFEVAAAPNQMFEFSVGVPGSVEVELHHLHVTVATIQVQP